MNKLITLSAVAAIALSACHTEELDTLPIPGLNDCGSDGHRLEASVNGDGWCANTGLIAMGSDNTVNITGIAISGSTLILQVDSAGIGTQTIGEGQNGVLWMELGIPFTSVDEDPGTVTILSHDMDNHRVSGTIDVVLHSADGPATREVSATFDVTYTVQ